MDADEFAQLVTLSKLGPSPDHVSITCERLALAQLERCAENLRAKDADGYRLLEATRCLHLAMVAAMTAALNGSVGIGALPERQRVKALEMLNAGQWDLPERVMPYVQLLEAVQTQDAMEWWPEGLKLATEEKEACATLNDARERIDHPKPSTYIESRAALRGICRTVAPIVERLCKAVFHHYEDDELGRISRVVASIVA